MTWRKYLKSVWLLVLLIPAAATAEQVNNFASTIHIAKTNVVQVTETIAYDFGTLRRHGIIRTIPLEYHPSDGKIYYLSIDRIRVSDDYGHPLTVQNSRQGAAEVIRIGDADGTVTGLQTYKISYELSPVIRLQNGRGFFTFNVTGNQWEVPIAAASVTVAADGEAALSDVKCYIGAFGSTAPCMVLQTFPERYSAANLSAGEGLTVEGYLPAGYVGHYLEAYQKPPLTLADKLWLLLRWLPLLLIALVLALIGWRHWRVHRRRTAQTVVAQYEPPAGFTPAELGLLYDDKSNMTEITATLIDLAVRGYLKIEQTQPKRWYAKAQYRLTKLKEPTDLADFEASLIKTIFPQASQKMLDDIDKTKMAATVSKVYLDIKTRLKDKGFYSRISDEPGVMQKLLDTGMLTEAGAKKWAEVKGFELYLSVAEKDRINFTDAPANTPERFSKLLPYAVALGVEKEWAKQFEGIDIAQSAGSWYVGYPGQPFTPYFLASDLSTGFAQTVSSNFTAPSSGGGGGFSGGGFGGGGGGSW